VARYLRDLATPLWSFVRSGRGVFVCSLAAGLLLGGGSLVYLEMVEESGGGSSSGGSLSSIPESAGYRAEQAGRSGSSGSGAGRGRRGPADAQRESGGPEAGESERPTVRGLEGELRGISAEHRGEYGVVVWRPGSSRVSVRGGERFESASLAKLPVLLALYREASEGSLRLGERVEMSEADIQPGTGTLQHRKPGTTLTLREYAEYLMKESDNTAWKVLEDRLGRERVRSELVRAGARSTWYAYGEHTTTPNDTLRLLRRVSDPDYTSPAHSREMLATMTGTAFEDRLPPGLPGGVRISHKIGTLGTSFSDAGIVYPRGNTGESGPHSRPYYVVVLSRDASETEARDAMREISLAAYRSLVDPEARPRSASRASAGKAE